jgi:dTMP kinase
MRGPFITFEGIDGCGKSTHIASLARHLTSLGVQHIITFEPGGTSFGGQVRSLVLSQETAGIGAVAELMLYASDRAEHVRTVIVPALGEGRLVLCDRFTDSSVAFQGYGRGLDLKLIAELNGIATGGLEPDLTILLDLDPAVAASRLESRIAGTAGKGPADRFDREARDFHSRVRDGYLRLAQAEPKRIRLIDSTGERDKVQERILSEVRGLLDRLNASDEEGGSKVNEEQQNK